MYSRRKTALKWILGLGITVILAWLAWSVFSAREPVHQGKTLSAWAQQFGTNNWGTNRAAAREAEQAIQAIGPAALPFLLDWMKTRDPAMKQLFRRFFSKPWQARLRLQDQSGETRRMGAHGIAALKAQAAAALPALMELAMHHPEEDGRYIAVFAIRTVGPAAEPAIPFLIQCLTNSCDIIRDEGAIALGEIQRQPEIAVPALLRYLETAQNSIHTFEPRDTIGALSRFGTNARPAVPLLLSLLNHANPDVRAEVTNRLPVIDPVAAEQAQVRGPGLQR